MPQLQNLVLTDRAATPVAHTFVPQDIVNNVGTVRESSGLPLGDNRVTVSMVRTSTGRFKGTVKYSFPIVATETINGVSRPTVLRTSYAELTVTFAPESTEAERNNVIGMVADSLGTSKVLVNDALVKLQGIY